MNGRKGEERKDRTDVFDEEDRPPGDLPSKILQVDGIPLGDVVVTQRLDLIREDGVGLGRQTLSVRLELLPERERKPEGGIALARARRVSEHNMRMLGGRERAHARELGFNGMLEVLDGDF
jgi:hypothetical protein